MNDILSQLRNLLPPIELVGLDLTLPAWGLGSLAALGGGGLVPDPACRQSETDFRAHTAK